MNKKTSQKLIAAMKEAALTAATEALRQREMPGFADLVQIKPDGSKVTPGDHEAQNLIMARLAEAMPDAAFMGEEGGVKMTLSEKGMRWVVDPVDGTSNFIRGAEQAQYPDANLRRWAVSIALKNQDKALLALVFCVHPDATSEDVHGIIYTATRDGPTLAEPVQAGALQPELIYKPGQKPGVDDRFSLGSFPHDPYGASETALKEAAGVPGINMGSFCCAAMDVVEGQGACANGINCEWDSAASYLLLAQAARPVAEFKGPIGMDGNQRYAVIAASSTDMYRKLAAAYWDHHKTALPLQYDNIAPTKGGVVTR